MHSNEETIRGNQAVIPGKFEVALGPQDWRPGDLVLPSCHLHQHHFTFIVIGFYVMIHLFEYGDLLQLCLSHEASFHNVLVCGESFCSGSAGEKIP